jgi:hypothetical protein
MPAICVAQKTGSSVSRMGYSYLVVHGEHFATFLKRPFHVLKQETILSELLEGSVSSWQFSFWKGHIIVFAAQSLQVLRPFTLNFSSASIGMAGSEAFLCWLDDLSIDGDIVKPSA